MLAAGKIVEYDPPYELLQNETGLFYDMVAQTGPEEQAHLTELARQAYDAHQDPAHQDSPPATETAETLPSDVDNHKATPCWMLTSLFIVILALVIIQGCVILSLKRKENVWYMNVTEISLPCKIYF